MICSVYKSQKRGGMYLYVDKSEGLTSLPEALLNQFGTPELAMTLLLEEGRPLANADAAEVLRAIDKQGFYLQLPVDDTDHYMKQVHQKNAKF